MFDDTHYVPILKSKRGELQALRDLSPLKKGLSITPLVEVPLKYTGNIGKTLADSWGVRDRVFVDCLAFESVAAASMMAQLAESGVKLVPVTSLNRPPEFQEAVSRANAAVGLGICFRVESFEIVGEDMIAKFQKLFKQLAIDPGDVDLVLDFGEFPRASVREAIVLARSVLATLPNNREWRTLTVAWSSFPKSLTDLKANTISLFPRPEWEAWNMLRTGSSERAPSFGDYAINHPRREAKEIKFRPAPNLRYTTETGYLLFRGKKSAGAEQHRSICRQLTEMKEVFAGADFSPGDAFIAKCAIGEGGPGSPSTWRYVGTSHHLALVIDQLATLSDS